MNSALVISEKSKCADRIFMFLEWIYSEQENYDLLMYGIKGKHYELEKGRIKLPEGNNAVESFHSWKWKPPFTNIEYERVGLNESESDLIDFYKIVRGKSEYPPHSGFVLDCKPIENIANKRKMSYKATEESIYNNMFAMEEIDGYVEDVKYQGIDLLLMEVQEQIDKWLEKRENCE